MLWVRFQYVKAVIYEVWIDFLQKNRSVSRLFSHLLHQVLNQDRETLCIRFLRRIALQKTLDESFESLNIIEHCEGSQQEQVFLCHIRLVLHVDVTLAGFRGHSCGIAHEEGRLHQV